MTGYCSRVVVERKHASAGRDGCVECRLEPVEVFLLDMSVAHFHVRTTVYADNHERIDACDESVIAPQIEKCFCCTAAPCAFVVAREDVERVAYAVDN